MHDKLRALIDRLRLPAWRTHSTPNSPVPNARPSPHRSCCVGCSARKLYHAASAASPIASFRRACRGGDPSAPPRVRQLRWARIALQPGGSRHRVPPTTIVACVLAPVRARCCAQADRKLAPLGGTRPRNGPRPNKETVAGRGCHFCPVNRLNDGPSTHALTARRRTRNGLQRNKPQTHAHLPVPLP